MSTKYQTIDGDNHKEDLPIMANTDDILIKHYIIHLNVNFHERIFDAKIYIFTNASHGKTSGTTPEPPNTNADSGTSTKKSTDNLEMILDCKDIEVSRVDEVILDHEECDIFNFNESEPARTPLPFKVDPWCVRIWKPNASNDPCMSFPRVLCIYYRTKPTGSSVSWRSDQDGRDCCFTQGAFINNRSLFPCQEPPVAMATWQAFITTPRDAVVVMSSDEVPRVVQRDECEDSTTYYCFSRIKLPMSTLALAIGFWQVVSVTRGCDIQTQSMFSSEYCYIRDAVCASDVQSRIIAPSSLVDTAFRELSWYLPKCLESATRHLGPYPFRRLDLLFLPRCFDSLGLASPNVTFVSQSLLAGDGGMLVHLAHELAHAWFGLLIGAADWTEEWLSEGFATYMEDHIYADAMRWSTEKAKEWSEIRTFLRYRTLVAEMLTTDSELQTLRPTNDDNGEHDESALVYIRNGLNPNKTFTQVHYMKGYFLLRHLSNLVGLQQFNMLLQQYVTWYSGKLVNSQEVLKLYFSQFPDVSIHGISVQSLNENWLESTGVPTVLSGWLPAADNRMYGQIMAQVEWWRKYNSVKHRKAKRRNWDFSELQSFETSEEMVAFLELLLDEPCLSKRTLGTLDDHYKLDSRNANVRHRWCELIIKHNYGPGLDAVRKFLVEDQGMGVYLYGELNLSGRTHLKDLAIGCWHQLQEELGESARHVLQEMLQD